MFGLIGPRPIVAFALLFLKLGKPNSCCLLENENYRCGVLRDRYGLCKFNQSLVFLLKEITTLLCLFKMLELTLRHLEKVLILQWTNVLSRLYHSTRANSLFSFEQSARISESKDILPGDP